MSKPYVNEAGKLVTMIVDGVEKTYEANVPGAVYVETDQLAEQPCSFAARGIEPYRAAIFVGPNGIEDNMSVKAAVKGEIGEKEACGIKIDSTSDNFSALVGVGGEYAIKDSELNFDTKSDGKNVCDFSGYGAAITALKGSKFVVENTKIKTVGVAKPALFSDNQSHCLFKNCDVEVLGGTLYEGYVNSADQKTMVAPPWVLGISGNARGINLEGDRGAATVVDTDFKANQWGVLSTDSGTNMQLYVIDSKMTLLGKDPIPAWDKLDPYSVNYGSGYGTYIIGNAHEEFFGADIKVGTMCAVVRGGTATYQSSKGMMKVTSPVTGETLYEGEGKGNVTKIYSDVFGWMAHGDGEVNVIDGTEVECGDALFLLKSNGVNMNLDNCVVNSKTGVLVQMIDDDDSLVGANFAGGAPAFNTEFNEQAGWPSDNGLITSKMPKAPAGGPGGPGGMPGAPGGEGGPGPGMKEPEKSYKTDKCYFKATNVALKGDLFNGSGYYGQDAKALDVVIGAGAVLDGAISATETRHINEKGEQNTHFTIKEFYYLGHVENRVFFNGDNVVEVVLKDGGVWNVTGDGIINALTVGEGCTFNGKASIDGKEIAIEAGKKYEGVIAISK